MNNRKTHIRSWALGLLAALGLLPGTLATVQAQANAEVGIGWSKAAQDRRGGKDQIIAAINQGFVRANNQMRNSQTQASVSIRLRNLFPAYADKANTGAVLADWGRTRLGTTETGLTQAVWEDRGNVDMAIFLTIAGDNRGEASGNKIHAVVNQGQANSHTSGHEMGHLYNCSHDRGNHLVKTAANDLPFDVYTSLASGGQANNRIIDYYSNPNVLYLRARTGTAARNNASSVLGNRLRQANRR